MQLTSLRTRLGAAACALLAAGLPAAAQERSATQSESGAAWHFDGSALFYKEQNRTNVVEPTARFTRIFASGQSFSAQFGFDVITGASPSGALPSGRLQTTTTPSGTVRTLPAGQLPTSAFHDRRLALDLQWTQPLGSRLTTTTGTHFSEEKDYRSLGGSAKVSLDLMHRLSTLTAGFGVNRDVVSPVGGVPIPLSEGDGASGGGIGPPDDGDGPGDDGEGPDEDRAAISKTSILGSGARSSPKRVTSGMVGISRILTRRWMLAVNLSGTRERGYLTEPYKVVSILEEGSGLTAGQLTEKRPSLRNRRDVLTSSVYHLTEDVVYLNHRYYWDDWGVRSHTIDLKFRHELPSARYLQPHLRVYTQTRADFYRFGLIQGEALPDFATSDYRLGPLKTLTLGTTYGFRLPNAPGEISVRAEYLRQWGDGHPRDAVGAQRRFDLIPPVDITSLMVGYSVDF